MAAKLKSISRTIPWSLLVKSILSAAVWTVLPYWLFLFIASGFYFIPLFRSGRFLLPFIFYLLFAAVLPQGFVSAIFLGFIFFLILGVKNLILVDRVSAYETLVLAMLFLGTMEFFRRFESPFGQIFPVSFILVAAFAILLKDLFPPGKKFLAAGLTCLILWQWLLAVMFLPINRFYQTAIAFLGGAVLAELLFAYNAGVLERKKILISFSVFFTVTAILLAANNWKI